MPCQCMRLFSIWYTVSAVGSFCKNTFKVILGEWPVNKLLYSCTGRFFNYGSKLIWYSSITKSTLFRKTKMESLLGDFLASESDIKIKRSISDKNSMNINVFWTGRDTLTPMKSFQNTRERLDKAKQSGNHHFFII